MRVVGLRIECQPVMLTRAIGYVRGIRCIVAEIKTMK